MGVHTIGVARRTNSGFAGELGWVQKMTINSDILIKNGTATMPDRFFWTRRSIDNDFSGGSKDLIMLSSDIALVRDFEGKTDEVTKAVECKFIFYIPYPFAQQTGQIAAQYRNNNGKWVNDFRDTLNLVVTYGYDSSYDEPPLAECSKCLIKVDFSISRLPTSVPTFTPCISCFYVLTTNIMSTV
eukprot:CAMPEP_0194413104 /NCGR_PEP_ID=MMETSP0176-20130528/11616_1 /TAXON_ID=216777 /ORGANISM="Proboscia alata, Strain PI-D3" /LENGTH=184 /DNA_ID=CAMNT_0039216273 /DNA_START=427 /DNA_END=978 /DNA_ORIENTATION=-